MGTYTAHRPAIGAVNPTCEGILAGGRGGHSSGGGHESKKDVGELHCGRGLLKWGLVGKRFLVECRKPLYGDEMRRLLLGFQQEEQERRGLLYVSSSAIPATCYPRLAAERETWMRLQASMSCSSCLPMVVLRRV